MNHDIVRKNIARTVLWRVRGFVSVLEYEQYWQVFVYRERERWAHQAKNVFLLLLLPFSLLATLIICGIYNETKIMGWLIMIEGMSVPPIISILGAHWKTNKRCADRICAQNPGRWTEILAEADDLHARYGSGEKDPIEIQMPDD